MGIERYGGMWPRSLPPQARDMPARSAADKKIGVPLAVWDAYLALCFSGQETGGTSPGYGRVEAEIICHRLGPSSFDASLAAG